MSNRRQQQVVAQIRNRLKNREADRLRTFRRNSCWLESEINIEKLARAGFFSIGRTDSTKCAFCAGIICLWRPDDNPMVRHAVYFPDCPFIWGTDVGNKPIEGTQHLINWELERIKPLLYELRLPPQWDNQSQIDSIQPQDANSPPPSISTTCHTDHDDENDDNNVNETTGLTATNFSLTGVCKICFDANIEMAFLPCRHAMSCIACSTEIDRCPHCRVDIKSKLRIYVV